MWTERLGNYDCFVVTFPAECRAGQYYSFSRRGFGECQSCEIGKFLSYTGNLNFIKYTRSMFRKSKLMVLVYVKTTVSILALF